MNINTKRIILIIPFCLLLGCSENKKNSFAEYSRFSPQSDLALNNLGKIYPNADDSDDGWGGAFHKVHLIDGLRNNIVYWNYGFAFTGGRHDYVDTCGWRQAVISFGKPVSINRVVIWRNTNDCIPSIYFIQYFDQSKSLWCTARKITGGDSLTKQLKKRFFSDIDTYDHAWATEDTFPTVTSNKIRYYLNNCNMDVVWLTEIEVYFDKPGDRPKCLVIK